MKESMTKQKARITLTKEIKAKFKAYHKKHPMWGEFHIILEDGNIDDRYVNFCIRDAKEHDDFEAVELGELLLKMTKTQRGKIYSKSYNNEYDTNDK